MLVGGNSNSCWNFPPQTFFGKVKSPQIRLAHIFFMAGLVVQPPSPAMILRAVASHSQATHPQRLQTESAAGRSQDPFDTMNLGVRTTTSCFDLCFLVVGGSLSNAGKTAITKNTKQHVDVSTGYRIFIYNHGIHVYMTYMVYLFQFISLHWGLHFFFRPMVLHIYRSKSMGMLDGKGGGKSNSGMVPAVVDTNSPHSRWFFSRDLFIPDHWRSPFQPLSWGHVNSPSQKGQKRIAR